MFPFHLTYRRKITSRPTSDRVEKLIQKLHHYKDIKASKQTNQISFTVGFFRSNWDLFGGVDSGEINWIKNEQMTYKINLTPLLIIGTIMSLFMGFISKSLIFGIICLTGLVGINLVITLMRHSILADELQEIINKGYIRL